MMECSKIKEERIIGVRVYTFRKQFCEDLGRTAVAITNYRLTEVSTNCRGLFLGLC